MKTHSFLRLIVACSIVLVFSLTTYAQAPPQNFSVDQHTSMATWDAPVSGQPNAYEIYLGDSLLAILDNTVFEYQINCLIYNDNYTSSIKAVYGITISEAVDFQWTSTYLYTVEKPFAEGDGQSVSFSLKTISPCGTFASNSGLIGFNIYKNGYFFIYVPYEQGIDEYVFATDQNASGIITYCAESVYDLSAFGLPSGTATSTAECQTLDLTIYDEIPFMEDWQSQSFETNNWTKDSDNWMIDVQNGNDEPCVKFHHTPIGSNYFYSLTSSTFDASDLRIGYIYLKFDLKLENIDATGTEFLKIKVKDSTNWITLDSFSNTGSFDWTTYTYNIGEYSIGQTFQIAFKAESDSSFQTIDWFIDNIEVYRECDAPEDLVGYIVWLIGIDEPANEISWNAPSTVLPVSEWKHWDTGTNSNSIQPDCEDCWVEVAATWPPSELEDVVNDTIESIKFFVEGTYQNLTLIIKVRTGEEGENIIYSDTLDSMVTNDWFECFLNHPILIESNTQYWICYEIQLTTENNLSFGTDNGPVVNEYSDLVKLSQGEDWSNISEFGLNFNWNIEFFVDKDPLENPQNLLGFQVYKNEMDREYEPFRFVNFIENKENYFIHDTCFNIPCNAFYKVNAVWGDQEDTCTSNFAHAMTAPEEDYVYIIYEGLKEKKDSQVELFPNPSKSQLTINSESIIKKINIYNSVGQEIIHIDNIEETQKTISVSMFEPGIYFIKIQTDKNILTRKFIKN